ncbi:hypothetical protein JT328_gp05 [Aeromonas phage BUCT551]|uniref:Uncharacterized protein n=2 Tax=Sharonstreetvirus TaxID=2943019 RepID=A0AAE9YGK3_9CAUD|nr:hypothetical protein JT328_gp05 [Aeromonas phage BUCT551]QOI69621.1 hypothetical protein [Aeromonas phage BUCT551]UIS24879.1 hypothetical protein pAEv1812_70 [Aeromonas phage pAEv1812]WCZ66142.1 hypothetical protein phiA034_gene0059 [Aeromonas phage phiA034]
MISRSDLLEAVETGRPYLVAVAQDYAGRLAGDVISRHRTRSGAERKQKTRRGVWQVVDAARQLRIA